MLLPIYIYFLSLSGLTHVLYLKHFSFFLTFLTQTSQKCPMCYEGKIIIVLYLLICNYIAYVFPFKKTKREEFL